MIFSSYWRSTFCFLLFSCHKGRRVPLVSGSLEWMLCIIFRFWLPSIFKLCMPKSEFCFFGIVSARFRPHFFTSVSVSKWLKSYSSLLFNIVRALWKGISPATRSMLRRLGSIFWLYLFKTSCWGSSVNVLASILKLGFRLLYLI